MAMKIEKPTAEEKLEFFVEESKRNLEVLKDFVAGEITKIQAAEGMLEKYRADGMTKKELNVFVNMLETLTVSE